VISKNIKETKINDNMKNNNEKPKKKKKKNLALKLLLFWIFIYTPVSIVIDLAIESSSNYNILKIIFFVIGIAYIVKDHNKDGK